MWGGGPGTVWLVEDAIWITLLEAYDPTSPDPWLRYAPGAGLWANTLTELSPGRGYWIDVTADCVLTVSE